MNTACYRISDLSSSIQKDLDALLRCVPESMRTKKWIPHVDVRVKDDQYLVLADVPGVDPKNIKVTMDGNLLTIEGERSLEATENKDDYFRIERFSGKFYRQLSLPDNVLSEDISAKCEKGVLKLIIAKQPKKNLKTIEVQGE